MEPQLLKKRLIGFFDILGFSGRLRSMSPQNLHQIYSDFIDDANSKVFQSQPLSGSPLPPTNFAKAQFLFDSLVLVSHPTSDIKHINSFVLGCILLMEKGFVAKLPLRGSIGLGDYLDDSARGIFISSKFPTIVEAEKNQQWSGCFILPEIENFVLDALYGDEYSQGNIPQLYQGRPVIPFKVPFKEGYQANNSLVRWCLNWVHMIDLREIAPAIKYLIEPKHGETKKFLEFIFSLPDDSWRIKEKYRPAVAMKLIKTQSSMRTKFTDEHGQGVEPCGKKPSAEEYLEIMNDHLSEESKGRFKKTF